MRWGMVTDLRRCNGCGACVLACKQENYLPPDVSRCSLLVGETGKYPNTMKFIYPVQCNHCKNPVCIENCPTGATYQREDGIIAMDADKCTGCQHCILLCPYNQRACNYGERKEYYPGQGRTALEELGTSLRPYPDGTVNKCDFCATRVDAGLARGLKPGVDREATPACVNTCMCKAKVFGDLDDPDSEVSKLLRENKHFVMHPELQTEPSLFYLSKTRQGGSNDE